jgi:hypothetical protein
MASNDKIQELIKIMNEKGQKMTYLEAEAIHKENYRKKCVKEMFELWVGREMFDEEYNDYIDEFDKAEKGYNLKNFIKNEKLKIKPKFEYKFTEWEKLVK